MAVGTETQVEQPKQVDVATMTGAARVNAAQMMTIPASQFLMAPPNPERVPFTVEAVKKMAQSIESDGLLHRPLVRPVSISNGNGQATKYKPISGNKRVYAMVKILGYQEVPCMVVDGLDADLAEAAEIAANLFTMPLSPDQIQKSLIDWHAIYSKRHPLATGKGVGVKLETEVQQRTSEIVNAKVEAGEIDKVTPEVVKAVKEKVKEQVNKEAKPFYKVIMETLNISAAAATRLARIARNLTKEQIDALHANKVTSDTIDQMAALGDEEEINKAIKLIASGMAHDEAVRQAKKVVVEKKKERKAAKQAEADIEYTKKTGKPAEAKAPPKEKPKKESDLTDDEWLQDHCGTFMAQLKRKAAFKRDAILYRRLVPHLSRVRTEWGNRINEAKSGDGNGGFFWAALKLVKAKHPSQWFMCETCKGTGRLNPDDKDNKERCATCMGSAYKVSTD